MKADPKLEWRRERMRDPAYHERIKAQKRAYWAANLEDRRTKQNLYKAAHREVFNARKRANYAKNREYEKARLLVWRTNNRAKLSAQKLARRLANQEKVTAQSRALYAENRVKIREQTKARYENNIETSRAYVRMEQKEWRTKNPARSREHIVKALVKRRVQTRLTPIVMQFTAADWFEIVAIYDGKCAYCGEVKPLTRDHIIPLVKGGHHVKENIRPACQSCNSKKGTRDLPVLVHRFGYSNTGVIQNVH